MTLERKTPLKRTSLKRTGFSRKPPKERGPRKERAGVNFSLKTKRKILTRAGCRCEAKLAGCSGRVEQYHHRRLRSAGGKGTTSNGLAVCGSCHRTIHAHTGWAYRHGLLVRRHRAPFEVEVFPGCGTACNVDHARQ